MDGELLRALYHELFHHRKFHTPSRCDYRDATILWIYFLGVLSDRSSFWAHEKRHWPLWARHLKRPSYSQLMRRLKTPAIQAHIQDLNQDLLRRLPTSTDKAVDGKPMVVSDYSKDPDAKVGRLTEKRFARGYKLHAIVNKHGVIETFSITGLNAGESTVARSLVKKTDLRGAILRADANYDSSPTYAAVAAAGGRLVAPRRKPNRGLGHRKHHPDRLRAIAEFEHAADGGINHKRHRLRIEQAFGHLTNLPFGLAPLPNWVRRQERVERWVAAKIVLYHLHLAQKQRTANAA
jgi:hypothetical protein